MKARHILILSACFFLCVITATADDEFGYTTKPDSSSTSPYPVGATLATTAVSPTGASTIDIEIQSPQGLSDMKPSISIAYNSQSSNGIVGWGCGVNGISVITRGIITVYHYGIAKGLTYTTSDAFYLDGVRLLPEENASGVEGSVYHPEGNPYCDVTLHVESTGIWFEVNSHNGVINRYGENLGCRQTYPVSGDTQHEMAWYICRSTDMDGNYMIYNYIKDGYSVYPSGIVYGINDRQSTAMPCFVDFIYESRPDTMRYMLEDTECYIGKRVSEIKSKTRDTTYRSYVMAYNDQSDLSGTKYSRLTTVTEKNGANEALLPTVLEWDYNPSFLLTDTVPSLFSMGSNEEGSKLFSADVNGDGLCDFYFIPDIPNAQKSIYLYQTVKNIDGTISHQYKGYTWLPNNAVLPTISRFGHGFGACDYNGDGVDDFVYPYYQNNNSANITLLGFPGLSQGQSLNYENIVNNYAFQSSSGMADMTIEDIDLNGKSDFIILEKKNPSGKYRIDIIRYVGGSNPYNVVNCTVSLPSVPKHLMTADCNNDGLPDLVVFCKWSCKVFFNRGTTNYRFRDQNSMIALDYAHNSVEEVTPGDFNGDGLVDFIRLSGSNNVEMDINSGNGTFTSSIACQLPLYGSGSYNDNNRTQCFAFDFDMDGKSDVFISKVTDQSTIMSYWLRSDGQHLSLIRSASSVNEDDALDGRYMLGNFSGNGQTELMNYGHNCWTGTYQNVSPLLRLYKNNSVKPSTGKVITVTDGYGNTTSYNYKHLSDTTVYNRGNESTFPMATITPQMQVVSKMTISNGHAAASVFNYSYSGLKIHMQGKGLLGFSYMKATDALTGEIHVSGVNTWNTNYFIPEKTYNRILLSDGSRNETEEMNNISNDIYTKYRIFPLYSKNTDFDNHIVRTDYTFDPDNGCLTEKKTVFDNTQMFKKESYSGYSLIGNRWLPSTLTSTWKHKDDNDSISSSTTFAYDSLGHVISEVSLHGTPLALTKNRTYDNFGNVLTEQVSGNGVLPLTSIVEYATDGRNIIRKSTNANPSSIHTYTYDLWGNVLTDTNMTESNNTLTTTYVYDNWGRNVRIVNADGTVSKVSYGWGNSDEYRFYSLCQGTSKPWVKTWYDERGRETRIQSIERGEVSVTTDNHYNSKGLIVNTTKSIGNGTTIVNSIYDLRDRLQTTTYNTGAYTNYVYGDRSVTATDQSGRVTETEYDAWGNTVSTTDDLGNTVSYTYYSNGKPQSVTTEGADGSSSTVEMEYDAAGNRTSLDDPDAGLITHTWSADGKLLSSTDARGNLTQNTYDNLGRLSTSTTGGITTTYNYGTSGFSKLRLDSISRQGLTLSYTYDQYGRTSSVTRNYGDGTLFTHTYSYDSYGRLEETDFPSGLETYYYYDSYGHLNGIATGGGDAWNLLSYNGLTMVTEAGTDNLHITTVNDNWGKLTERYLTLGNDTTKRCRLAFTYDNLRGNLTSRTGVNGASVTESFTYDTLDRLTSAGNETYTYAANGNILNKTYIGAYTYSTDKPHAVAHVQNTSNRINKKTHSITYDAFGKMTAVEYTSSIGRESYETDGQRPTQPVIISQRHDISYGPDGERWKSVTRDVTSGGTDTQTIFYAGDYERVITRDSTVIEYHYLGEGIVAVITDGGDEEIYYAVTDNVGSYVHLVNAATGTAAFSAKYDSWGRMTKTVSILPFHRGYGGHEMLTEFGLVNMNGRMYDFNIGRFLSPDNYVQMPDDSQSFNRYSYCLNNPLKYTDPSGEAWWVPIVAGALIGGAISGASYAVSVGITGGTWNGREFLKSIGIGAFAGALSAGMGQASAALGISKTAANTLGYKCFSQITNSIATNAVFGNSMDWSDVAGIAVSSFVATKLPDYKATGKSLFSNFIGETVHNTLAGATTGFVQGATKSLIKNDARFVFENTMGGAVSGFSRTVAHNALLGSPYYTNPAYDKSSGIIRRGGLFGLFANMIKNGQYMGITLGRNSYSVDGNLYTTAHESYHLSDIERMGWAAFYSRIISEYIKYGYGKSYGQPGTLEYNAEIYGTNTLKILSPPIVIKPKLLFPF